MKKNYVLGIAALSAVVLLAGCGNKELTPTEYCEQNGGVAEDGICLFEDGSYCGDEAYAKGECKAGEIIYNTVEEVVAEEVNPEEAAVEEENAIEEEVAEVAEDVEVAREEAVNEAEEAVEEAVEEVTEEVAE